MLRVKKKKKMVLIGKICEITGKEKKTEIKTKFDWFKGRRLVIEK